LGIRWLFSEYERPLGQCAHPLNHFWFKSFNIDFAKPNGLRHFFIEPAHGNHDAPRNQLIGTTKDK